MDYLSDIEKAELNKFATNKVMFEAVKKVLLAGIYQNGVLKAGEKAEPLKNFALGLAFKPGISNEMLGADLRACAEGINTVELGFKKICEISVPVKSPIQRKEVNPGE